MLLLGGQAWADVKRPPEHSTSAARGASAARCRGPLRLGRIQLGLRRHRHLTLTANLKLYALPGYPGSGRAPRPPSTAAQLAREAQPCSPRLAAGLPPDSASRPGWFRCWFASCRRDHDAAAMTLASTTRARLTTAFAPLSMGAVFRRVISSGRRPDHWQRYRFSEVNRDRLTGPDQVNAGRSTRPRR